MAFNRSEAKSSPPEILSAKSLPHTHTIIVLHGRGDTAKNFSPMFMLSSHSTDIPLRQLCPHTKWIFPCAPRRSVVNTKLTMNQWFNISSLVDPSRQEESQLDGLKESALMIRELIEEEMKTIPAENIILMGLSQGCATILFTLLTLELPLVEGQRLPPRLGAVVGMSGWLPLQKRMDGLMAAVRADEEKVKANGGQVAEEEVSVLKTLNATCALTSLPQLKSCKAMKKTPVWLGHGTADEKVDAKLGEGAVATLQSLGFRVKWVPYEGFGHWYKEPEEIDDIFNFLREKVAGFEMDKTGGLEPGEKKPGYAKHWLADLEESHGQA